MKRLQFAAAALLCAVGFTVSASASAQTGMTPVTASNLKMGGVAIPSGTVTFTMVNANTANNPVPFTDGSGSYNGPFGFQFAITNGALPASASVPDQCMSTASTANTPLTYKVDVVNAVTKTGFTIAPVTGVCGSGPFALDRFAPVQTATVYPTGLNWGPVTPARCIAPAIYENSTTNTLYIAGPGNTCVAVAGNGSGGTNITSVVTTALAAGATPTGSVTGSTLYLGIPAGAAGTPGTPGVNGTSPVFVPAVTVTTLTAGTPATASIDNTNPAQPKLSINVPAGAAGAAPVFTVAPTVVGAAGSQPSVAISGTTPNFTLTFTLPAGASGNGTAIALKTNGTANGSQSILNLVAGTGVSVVDNGSGTITISATGSVVPQPYAYASFPSGTPAGTLIYQTDAVAGAACTAGGGTVGRMCKSTGSGSAFVAADQIGTEKNVPSGYAGLDLSGRTATANTALPTWGKTINVFSDSIGWGAQLGYPSNTNAAATRAAQSYPSLLAADLNLPPVLDPSTGTPSTLFGIPGDTAADVWARQIAIQAAAKPTLQSRQLSVYALGTNDAAYGTAAYAPTFRAITEAALSYVGTPREYTVLAGDAALVANSGTCTTNMFPTTSPTYSGSTATGIVVSSSMLACNGNVTITQTTAGNPLYFYYVAGANLTGTFNLVMDGAQVGSYSSTLSTVSNNAANGNTVVMVRMPVAAGTHSITTTGTTGTVGILGSATMPTKAYGNRSTVAVVDIYPQNSSYTPSFSEAIFAALRASLSAGVKELQADGLDLRYVLAENYITSTDATNYAADGTGPSGASSTVHLSQTGHLRMYRATAAAFSAVPAAARVVASAGSFPYGPGYGNAFLCNIATCNVPDDRDVVIANYTGGTVVLPAPLTSVAETNVSNNFTGLGKRINIINATTSGTVTITAASGWTVQSGTSLPVGPAGAVFCSTFAVGTNPQNYYCGH